MRPPILRGSFDPSELVIDNFAGGGGASTGIEEAIGRPVDFAINHDPEAIAMHRANHPGTYHFLDDVWAISPRDVCGSRPVGLLWASPDCVDHSRAKGGRPRDSNIRSLAWVVVRWAQAVRPRVIFLENVPEFEDWGPLTVDGQPDKVRLGETFKEWVAKLTDLGYKVEWRELIAADYGTPTTRKRLFLVARCDGRPIVWPEQTHGRGRASSWRPAAEIIDWSIPCPSIFDRKKPLAEATLRRIFQGLKRYVLEAANPFIIPLTHHGAARVHGIDEPLRTVTAAHRGELALVGPTLIQRSWGERPGQAPRVPGLEKPLGTIVAGGVKHALVAPVVLKHYGGVVGHRVDDRPIGTVTSQDHHSLASAVLVNNNFGEQPAKGLDEPLRTVTTQHNKFQLTAAFLAKWYGTSTGAPLDVPLPTVTANGKGGGHLAAVQAFLIKYYSAQAGQHQDVREVLETVTSKARFGLVTVHGVDYQIVDVGMRMLQPHELYAAQGFPDGYIIKPDFNGRPLTKTAQIKLCGNSVCPPVAQAIVAANIRAAA